VSDDEQSTDDNYYPQHFSFAALLDTGEDRAPAAPAAPSPAAPAPAFPPPSAPPPPVTPVTPASVTTPPPLPPVLFEPAPAWKPRHETITWAPPVRRRPRGKWPIVAGALVMVMVVVAAALVVVKPWQSKYPSNWDARLAPIAAHVARMRGLDFEHPVAVHFLSVPAFEARVGGPTELDASARREIERTSAELRAAGLIGGDVDLRAAFSQAQTSGTLAYYDPHDEEIFVRGQTLDVAHRVTLAHELTHVLQDQHFDLERLERAAEESDTGDGNALTALIEGDAVRIENEYVDQLSAAEKAQYDQQTQAEEDRFNEESGDVPEIVKLGIGAPYVYGPYSIRMLLAAGGNSAVDKALAGTTPSARMFIEPGVFDAVRVSEPALPAHAVRSGPAATFSAFDMYLMLAARGDAQGALRAADAIVGGRETTYKIGNGPYCMQVALMTQGLDGRTVVAGALQAWVAQIPGATLNDSDGVLRFTTCDPGAQSTNPATDRIRTASELLALRSEITAELAEAGRPAEHARCAARLMSRHAELVSTFLAPASEATPAQQQAIAALVAQIEQACQADSRAGLSD
jgi:hypothetical protein